MRPEDEALAMSANRPVRYCRCGTRLARDNPGRICSACQGKARDLLVEAPKVPAEFWSIEQIRDALASWHMGQVIAAYRRHPHHGQFLRQEVVARWAGLTQAQLSRIENGPPIKDLDRLVQWARILGIPAHLLWFQLPDQPGRAAGSSGGTERRGEATVAESPRPVAGEIDDMNRRELLRIVSMTGSVVAADPLTRLDWERMLYAQERPGATDAAALNQYAVLNTELWKAYATATSKTAMLPAVRRQLGALTASLRSARTEAIHRRLCGSVSDLFQLCGEILFDADQYTDAAHCYTLAVTAAKGADAFDLWACALTRHAFIAVYERQFTDAAPMLELAATVSQRGDRALSTGYWVQTVLAQALAGLGDLNGCQHALDTAEHVNDLGGSVHNGGWLRFDGSRLAEERGACYIQLRQPDLAEPILLDALDQGPSLRRRGGVLTDLAMAGVQRRDPDQVVMYASAALDLARHTHSGVIGHRLTHLRQHLTPLRADGHIRHLSRQITTLTVNSSAG
jgi:transcriptional regulator with XRE-family HTH domain